MDFISGNPLEGAVAINLDDPDAFPDPEEALHE